MNKIRNNNILDFYGIEKPLFVINGLSGDDLNRFVDRETILDYFIASIQMGRQSAVIGEPGTGKTSFLLKLMEMMKDSLFCEYLRFSCPVEDSERSGILFLRKLLQTLLYLIEKNDRSLNRFDEEKIRLEIHRSEHTNIGINTIVSLLEKIDKPIVFFIDGLDRTGRYPLESPFWEKDVRNILKLAGKIALTDKLKFVFALRIEFYEKLRKALRNEGDDSLLELIDSFKKLECFDLEFAYNAVEASLKYARYKGEIEDLFENGVIEVVLNMAKGNPLLFMYYLIELSKNAFLEKQPKITLSVLKNYLREINKRITETKWNSLLKKTGGKGKVP